MKLRLFIAINLPENLNKKINQTVETLQSLFDVPMRFLDSAQWHLTVSFLGYQDVSAVDLINQALKKTTAICAAPVIELENLSYGPQEKNKSGPKNPRMIWIEGSDKTSNQLDALRKVLESNLVDAGVNFRMENRTFQAHLTLARFEIMPKGGLPKLERQFSYQFEPTSLDLMESKLYRSGARYSLLAGFDFMETT